MKNVWLKRHDTRALAEKVVRMLEIQLMMEGGRQMTLQEVKRLVDEWVCQFEQEEQNR